VEFFRRTLFEGRNLRIGHFLARPSSEECGPVECQQQNVLVLPLAGVFARHDAPRRHVVSTPAHATFITAGTPYRLSYPGCIGDSALTFWYSGDPLPKDRYASHALLPPQAMLERSRFFRRLLAGDAGRLEIEERALGLLGLALGAARRNPPDRAMRTRVRIEQVKEAIALDPARKWTLQELARIACASPWHLAHAFRREVGVAVHAYVLRARLAGTLETVLDTRSELSRVAQDAGFASHSHFTARFRALFGIAPSALRAGARPKRVAELRKIVTARVPAAA
jgi:AraC family transcriptional regulator